MTFLVTSDSNFSLGENEDSPTNIVKAILTFTRGQRHKIHTKLAQMTIHALVKVHSTKLSSLEVKYLNKIQWLREKLRPKKKKNHGGFEMQIWRGYIYSSRGENGNVGVSSTFCLPSLF
jgi:hypothetical protein